MGARFYPLSIVVLSAAAARYFCKIIGPDRYIQETITSRTPATRPPKPFPLSVAIPQEARRAGGERKRERTVTGHPSYRRLGTAALTDHSKREGRQPFVSLPPFSRSCSALSQGSLNSRAGRSSPYPLDRRCSFPFHYGLSCSRLEYLRALYSVLVVRIVRKRWRILSG